ncbi:MAG: hypothetical protein GJV46_07160 [Geobacter sp.]|nr:hypothetical protein [Geobacter sp.]
MILIAQTFHKNNDGVSACNLWALIDSILLDGGITPISLSFDSSRRIYADDSYIYKIVLTKLDLTGHLRHQNLEGEYIILCKCAGLSGLPKVVSYEENNTLAILKMHRIYGTPLTRSSISTISFMLVTVKVGILLLKLVCRGVIHNDIKQDNILIDKDSKVFLVDFDQAIHTTFIKALIKTFFTRSGKGDVMHSYLHLIKDTFKRKLPPKLVRTLKTLSGKQVLDNKLPVLPTNAKQPLLDLLKAWQIAQNSDASSPGAVVAYYSFIYDGVRFPGERSWNNRWNVLKVISDYRNKRVLELGCNMALLSTHLLRDCGAEAALCVDIDEHILKAAAHVSTAIGVKPVFRQQNLDDPENWEEEISAFSPDIVFALNVLNWVENKDRLMEFLGRFKEIVFEGHDSVEVETERFKNVGFTNIVLVTMTERNRPVLHCRK